MNHTTVTGTEFRERLRQAIAAYVERAWGRDREGRVPTPNERRTSDKLLRLAADLERMEGLDGGRVLEVDAALLGVAIGHWHVVRTLSWFAWASGNWSRSTSLYVLRPGDWRGVVEALIDRSPPTAGT